MPEGGAPMEDLIMVIIGWLSVAAKVVLYVLIILALLKYLAA